MWMKPRPTKSPILSLTSFKQSVPTKYYEEKRINSSKEELKPAYPSRTAASSRHLDPASLFTGFREISRYMHALSRGDFRISGFSSSSPILSRECGGT